MITTIPKPAGDVLRALLARVPELEPCAPALRRAFTLLLGIFEGGGQLLLCGNGGSAADCQHWAAELLKGFTLERPLSAAQRASLEPALATGLQQGLPALPLPVLSSLTSAVANDRSADLVYAQAVWALGRPGDGLVGISTSGGAENVRLALEAARVRGMATLALTGRDPGCLAAHADVVVAVPAVATWRVQELHLPVYHALSAMLERSIFSLASG